MNEEFQGGYNPEDGMYYAKGTFDNEVEYNNEVICLVNHSDSYFQELGKSIQEKRFNIAHQLIQDFVGHNSQNFDALTSLGAYEGDHDLLNEAQNYLNEMNNLLQSDYTQIINLLQEESTSPQELNAHHEKLNKRYQDITAKLSEAFQVFTNKYYESDEFDPAVGGYNPEEDKYYPKGSYDNEAEYYNEIVHLVGHKDQFIHAIANAINANEVKSVDELLAQFKNHNQEAIKKLEQLGIYEDDADLYNASQQYLLTLTDLINNDYQEMIHIFKAEDRTDQEFQEKQAQFFEKMEIADNALAHALDQFIARYDKDNLTEGNYEGSLSQGMERKEYDQNNPYLQPIHGITIEDYAAGSAKLANGMTEEQVAKALGVELPQWDEANQLWQQRMQQDTEMTVIGLFGEFFAVAEHHPKFQNLTDDSSVEANQENLRRIKEDPSYYLDLTAAMQSAHKYGLDGAQWLRENHGLSLGDFQGVAMQWAYSPAYMAIITELPDRIAKFDEIFAAEMGGNIADDVEF